METTFTIIHTDGKEEMRTAELPATPNYWDIKAIVDPIIAGDYFEHVTVLHNDVRTDMFVDEDGLGKELPRNEKATAIYRANWLKHNPSALPESLPFIAGTAVLFSRQIWF